MIENMGDFRALDPFFRPLSKALRDSLTVITFSTYTPRKRSSTSSSRFRTTRTTSSAARTYRALPRLRVHILPRPLLRPPDALRCEVDFGRIFARLRRGQPRSDVRHRGERSGPVPSCPVAGGSSVILSCEGLL